MSINWTYLTVSDEPRAIGVGNPKAISPMGKTAHSFILARAECGDLKPGSLVLWHSTARVGGSGQSRPWSGATGYTVDRETITRALSGQLGSRVIKTFALASEVLPSLVGMHPDVSAHERIRLGVLLRELSAHFEQAERRRRRTA